MPYKPQIIGYDTINPQYSEKATWTGRKLQTESPMFVEVIPAQSSENGIDATTFYSIGYQFMGGNHKDPSNWRYHHSTLNEDDGEDGRIKVLTETEIKEVLSRMNSDPQEILMQYLKLI